MVITICDELFVEKRFKKDGFQVNKLDDNQKKYKSPDFKIIKNRFACLVEVKSGFKKGEVLETLSRGATRFDSTSAIDDYFRLSQLKFKEHILNNPLDKKLPYLIIFTTPFYISNRLIWSDNTTSEV